MKVSVFRVELIVTQNENNTILFGYSFSRLLYNPEKVSSYLAFFHIFLPFNSY